MYIAWLNTLVILLSYLATPLALAQKGEYLTSAELHALAFPDQPMQWQTLWINQNQRESIEEILGHALPGLRIRYWGHEHKTAWIFEEIGKELPITVGIIIDNNKVRQLRVMNYRESRGGEVRHDFFTQQFHDISLVQTKHSYGLDQPIDGITGATLSVRALKKVATLALYCHTQTPFSQPPATTEH